MKKQLTGFCSIAAVLLYILSLAAGGQEKRDPGFHAKGYLVDIACAAVHSERGDGSWGGTHNRHCLQSQGSATAGFALLLPNGRVYLFDPVGNALARKAIASTRKEFDFRIEVSGELVDKDLRVKSLRRCQIQNV
jgi:hypothetical protein